MTEKKIKKMSVFDMVIIVILVLAIAASCFYVYTLQKKGDKCEVTFTVEFREVDESFIQSVTGAPERGDDIKDSIKGYYLGKAVEVKMQPDTKINFDETAQKFVQTELPNKYMVYLTVRGMGTETDDSLYCEGQPIKVGAKMSLKGKGYAQTGYVTDVYAVKVEGGLFR